MSENRSMRVTLSADVAPYVTSMQRAAEATRGIAVAAGEVRTKINEIGSGAGLPNLARDLTHLGTALRGLSGARDVALVANAIRTLSGAGTGLTTAVGDIRRFASALGRITPASAAGMREIGAALHGIGSLSMGGAADELTRVSAGIRRLIRDANSIPALRALATALRDLGAAGGGLGNLGNVGNSLRGMQSQIDQLRHSIAGLRGAAGGGSGGSGGSGGIFGQIFGGAALGNIASNIAFSAFSKITSGIKSTITATADYETEIKTFGAVLQATPAQLKAVSDKALALGADFTIAGANAADAAVTMTELGKGGLSIADSMTAAKGSLQLASAGSVSFTAAADIMTSALASYQLQASQSGMVTDLLANTANAARGNISDFAEAFKYAGTVSHQAGYSIQDTASILALFAKNGLTGSMAGTVLKEMLLKLEAPSGKAAKSIQSLGIQVYDANKHLISGPKLADALAAAHKRMGNEAFNAAAATVFGARAIQGASIMAAEGGVAITDFGTRIHDGAGAAAFSAARMSGLGGAIANLKNQAETAQIVIGEKFSPALQKMLGGIATAIPKITNFLAGPAIGDGFSKFGTFFQPLITGASDLASKAMPYVQNFLSSVGAGFQSIVTFIHPVVTAIGDFWKHAADNGSVAKVGGVLAEVGTAFKDVLAFIAPVGAAIGGAIKWIGGLGEFGTVVGTVVTAMLGFRLVKPLLTGLFGVVPGFTAATAAVRGFGATYRALGSTGMGSVASALGAATQGAANLGKGLLSAFGGPVGIAIMGITTVIALWPTIMNKLKGSETSAATATQNHTDAVKSLSDALETSNGKIDDTIRKNALEQLHSASWGRESHDVTAYADRLANLGVTYSSLVDGMLNVPGAATKINNAYDTQVKSLQGVITAGRKYTASRGGAIVSYSDEAKAAQGNLDILRQLHDGYAGMAGSLTDSTKKYQQNEAAIKGTTTAAGGLGAATTAGSGGVKDLKSNTGDMTIAMQAAQIQTAKTGTAVGKLLDPIGTAKDAYKAFASTIDGINIAPDSKGVDQYTTDTQDAFAKLKDTLKDATDQASLFWFAMVDPNKVTTQQTIYADAAALRAVGAALRDRGVAAVDVPAAKAKMDSAIAGHVGTADDATVAQDKATISADNLAKAEAALQKMESSGKATASGLAAAHARVDTAQITATKSAQLAADAQTNVGKQLKSGAAYDKAVADATNAYADAQDKAAGSASTLYDAQIKSGETASKRIQQIYTETAARQGSAAGVQAVTDYLTTERKAFIDSEVASGQNVAQANKDADSLGLIAANATSLLSKDAAIKIQIAKDVQTAGMNASKTYTLNFVAQTKDALGDIGLYGQTIKMFPRSVMSKFNADIATAALSGQRLYRIYDATKKTWQATFETPGSATSQIKAGKLVQQYDKAKGTWTANLTAKDGASTIIGGVHASLDSIHDKTVNLKVNASGVATPVMLRDGSFRTGSGAIARADGGYISGPGGPREDKIHAMVSNGEFVVNAASTAKHLPLLTAINNRYADGGLIGGQKTMVNMSASGNIAAAVNATNSILATAQKSGAALVAAANAAAAAAAAAGSQAPSGLLGSQDPSSFGWGVGKNIVPFSFQGMPFPSGVAAGTSSIWTSFLSQLVPTIPGGLRSGENFGFEDRANVNSPGRKSFHAYGLALDVNAPENGNGTNPGTGPGQVPASAGALAQRYNMLWGGEFNGTKDPMHFELHESPQQLSGGSAAVSGGASSGPIANLSGSGVERWRALATKVATAKGEDLASVQVMLNQMSRESSGNPRAINLTDINAQRGTPSVGLLQFIPATFSGNADPGFSSDIYDPESQMRAWYNYINGKYSGYQKFGQRGYGAYADGGLVRGPGTGRSDSIPARVSNGEYIVNANSTSANLPLLHAINGYARGGLVSAAARGGVTAALAGYPPTNMGAEQSGVVQALQTIAQMVATARDAVTPKHDAEVVRWDALMSAKATAWANVTAAESKLKATEAAARGAMSAQAAAAAAMLQGRATTSAARVAAAEQRLAFAQAAPQVSQSAMARIVAAEQRLAAAQASSDAVRISSAARVAAAERRLTDAQAAPHVGHWAKALAAAAASLRKAQVAATAGQSASASRVISAEQRLTAAQSAAHTGQWGKAVASAEAGLRKAQAVSAAAQSALEQRIAAITASKSNSAAARVELAQLQLTKTVTLSQLSVHHAQQQYDAAVKTRKAYELAANAAAAYQQSQQHNFQLQQANAAQVDRMTVWLADQSAKLGQLRADRANMMGGISSTVAGFDGGILGHPDTRNTFATILKGQQYDAAQAQKFNLDITKLRKLGLSNASLNSIAAAGVDGGGITAAALAKATPAQIKQLNAVGTQLHHIGDNVGNVVAGSFYDAGIHAATGFVNGLKWGITSIQKTMDWYASAAVEALTRRLKIHSPSQVTHELGVHTVTGFTNGVRSGYGAAQSAMAGMVQVPHPFIPQQSYGRMQAPVVNLGGIKVFVGDREITDIVSVEVGGFATELGHSFEKAGMQR